MVYNNKKHTYTPNFSQTSQNLGFHCFSSYCSPTVPNWLHLGKYSGIVLCGDSSNWNTPLQLSFYSSHNFSITVSFFSSFLSVSEKKQWVFLFSKVNSFSSLLLAASPLMCSFIPIHLSNSYSHRKNTYDFSILKSITTHSSQNQVSIPNLQKDWSIDQLHFLPSCFQILVIGILLNLSTKTSLILPVHEPH